MTMPDHPNSPDPDKLRALAEAAIRNGPEQIADYSCWDAFRDVATPVAVLALLNRAEENFKIGDPVTPSFNWIDKFGEWEGAALWIVAIQWSPRGLLYSVCEAWPPTPGWTTDIPAEDLNLRFPVSESPPVQEEEI